MQLKHGVRSGSRQPSARAAVCAGGVLRPRCFECRDLCNQLAFCSVNREQLLQATRAVVNRGLCHGGMRGNNGTGSSRPFKRFCEQSRMLHRDRLEPTSFDEEGSGAVGRQCSANSAVKEHLRGAEVEGWAGTCPSPEPPASSLAPKRHMMFFPGVTKKRSRHHH